MEVPMNKHIVVVSDLHCGSEVALRSKPANKTQEGLKAAWKDSIKWVEVRPDLLIVNGDANDGQDRKGLSIKENDVPWQIEEAEELVKMWNPKQVAVVEGSAYHTGDTVQYERFLAGYLDREGIPATFHTKFRAKINGWFKLQARHKVGRSVVPWGIHTAPSRSQTNQVINAAIEAKSKGAPIDWPHLSIFSHVHYWSYSESAQGAVMTTPCWKAIGDRYGDTQCDGHVDVGVVHITVGNKGEWSWRKRLYPARLESRTVEL
jgi:hypothetical protein